MSANAATDLDLVQLLTTALHRHGTNRHLDDLTLLAPSTPATGNAIARSNTRMKANRTVLTAVYCDLPSLLNRPKLTCFYTLIQPLAVIRNELSMTLLHT